MSELTIHKHVRKKSFPWLAIVLAFLSVVSVTVIALQFRGLEKSKVTEHIQIHVFKDEPPPPPPPPKDIKKLEEVEPLMSEVPLETQIEEIPEVLEEAPPELTSSGPIAADGRGTIKAGAGGSGRGVVGGSGGRGTYNKYAKFAGYIKKIQDDLRDRLRKEGKLPKGSFEITMMLTLDDYGKILATEIVGSSGDEQFDRAVESGIRRIGRISDPPPPDMPRRPVVRISAL